MSVIPVEIPQGHAQALIALAQLLEHIEHSGRAPDPAQYRTVVARLKRTLAEPGLPQALLDAVLRRHTGTAELYENMTYEQAGLSRASLERSIASETLATQTLARIARQSRSPHQ
jgi:hypothetical protein